MVTVLDVGCVGRVPEVLPVRPFRAMLIDIAGISESCAVLPTLTYVVVLNQSPLYRRTTAKYANDV